MKIKTWISLGLVAACFFPLLANTYSVPEEGAFRARNFTEGFYRWYLEKGKDRSVESILLHKKEVLAPALYQALKADRDLQAKHPGELAGLDFDPFVNAQDIPLKVVVGDPSAKGSNYAVPIFTLWDSKKPANPAIIAEVTCQPTACQFVNLSYDQGKSNLLAILKQGKN